MKKLVFLFVAFAAVSFASCGNKAANTEATVDSTAAVVEEVAVETVNDSCCGDSACCADSAACCSEKTAE